MEKTTFEEIKKSGKGMGPFLWEKLKKERAHSDLFMGVRSGLRCRMGDVEISRITTDIAVSLKSTPTTNVTRIIVFAVLLFEFSKIDEGSDKTLHQQAHQILWDGARKVNGRMVDVAHHYLVSLHRALTAEVEVKPAILPMNAPRVARQTKKAFVKSTSISDLRNDIGKILAIIEEKQKAKPPIFTPANNHYLEWEGLAFRHSTEIELAKELERRGVMFFPSAGVRVTNSLTDERKTLEPDFLILYKGKMGILELDGESHKEKHYSDAQRARIFKKQGISIVEHYPSSMPPRKIVDDFLEILEAS